MTTSAIRRMIELSGAEALWLLEGATRGRLVYTARDLTAVRPAAHVLEYGRLIVRAPAPAGALADAVTVTYEADEISPATGTGWLVTTTGPAEVITVPDEAAHYRRTLWGWTHGPHDTVLRIHPKAVQGYRLAHSADPPGAG
ncbi:pyridoxamine 5'-phosphate oxidase family protein [Streptomyces sp. NPDC020096]